MHPEYQNIQPKSEVALHHRQLQVKHEDGEQYGTKQGEHIVGAAQVEGRRRQRVSDSRAEQPSTTRGRWQFKVGDGGRLSKFTFAAQEHQSIVTTLSSPCHQWPWWRSQHVSPNEEAVQQRRGWRVNKDVQDDLQHPAHGEGQRHQPQEQLHPKHDDGDGPRVGRVLSLWEDPFQLRLIFLQHLELRLQGGVVASPLTRAPLLPLLPAESVGDLPDVASATGEVLGPFDVLCLGDGRPGATNEPPNEVQGQRHEANGSEEEEQQPAQGGDDGHGVNDERNADLPRLGRPTGSCVALQKKRENLKEKLNLS